MGPDNGVLIDHRLAANNASAGNRGVGLLHAGVGSPEAMQAFLEEGAETVVSLDGVNEEGIAAGFGLVEDVEEGSSGGLLLVGNVGVPCYGAGAVRKELVD